MKNSKAQKLTFLALSTAFALVLSYIEFLLPPIFAAVPGIKLGLANIATVFLLYRFGVKDAATVALLRVALSSMLFGNPMIFLYSIVGAALSILVMSLLKKNDFLSTVGVSTAGGVAHNVGQIIVAMIMLDTAEIGYYMIILAVTGTVSGIFVGLLSGFLLRRLKLERL